MKRDRNICGAAMVFAMIFIVITVIAVGGYLAVIIRNSNLAKKMNDSIKALYLAEAGIERVVSDLEDIGVWPGTGTALYTNTPLGEGTFTVSVRNLVNNNRIRLRSDGNIRDEERIITAYVSRPSAFDWGVFGDDGVFLDSNARIDSYNSQAGPYDPLNPGANGDTGTNAGDGADGVIAVDLGSNSEIRGDVVIGPGGELGTNDITLDSNAVITGTPSVAQSVTSLPAVSPPGWLAGDPNYYRGSIALGGSDSATINQSGWYASITLDSNSYIEIDTDITLYIVGAFELDSNTHIDIVNNASVTIYMGGTFDMDNNTAINNVSQNPLNLTLYGTSTMTSGAFDSNSSFYGAIYTPTVDFQLDSNAVIFGSLVANSVNMDSNAVVHYDEALAGTGPGTGGLLDVYFWQEKEPEELI